MIDCCIAVFIPFLLPLWMTMKSNGTKSVHCPAFLFKAAIFLCEISIAPSLDSLQHTIGVQWVFYWFTMLQTNPLSTIHILLPSKLCQTLCVLCVVKSWCCALNQEHELLLRFIWAAELSTVVLLYRENCNISNILLHFSTLKCSL
jgi:hypothetical protein